ncbi:hypothetical protein KCV07_g857, partial [Aureobasidium melanogenum]
MTHHPNSQSGREVPTQASRLATPQSEDEVENVEEHPQQTGERVFTPESWRGCLRDLELMEAVKSKPREWLEEEDKAVLYEVGLHFATPCSDPPFTGRPTPEPDVGSDSGSTEGRPTKRPRPNSTTGSGRNNPNAASKARRGPKTRNPWQRVLNLQRLSLPPAIASLLQENGDPRDFLNDKERLVYLTDDQEQDSGSALMVCYEFAQELQRREGVDRIRLLFIDLFFHDMIRCLFPEATGKKMGHLMKEDAAMLLAGWEGLDVDIEELRNTMNDWSKCGRKLDWLCRKFGEGCLFYISDDLSQNFLLNQMPMDGEYTPAAMAHLKSLGLDRLAERSGANSMAAKIRKLLLEPFKELASQQARR